MGVKLGVSSQGNGLTATTDFSRALNFKNLQTSGHYVPHSGHYMHRQFNIQYFHVLPTQCIYVFCVDLRTNSDYFCIQH
jgi:hypothetical protein